MHKNDRFTFKKYSDLHWHAVKGRARAYTYVPDEIFEPVLTTLQSQAQDILKYSDVLMIDTLKAGPGKRWSWPRTLITVQAVWQGMDAEYGDFVAQLIDDANIRRHDVKVQWGDGQCFSDFAVIESDGTLNDPVCAVHESGHLVAFMRAPDIDLNQPAPNIKEIQAMFAQEHGYAYLLEHAEDDRERTSIRRHRMSYYTGILSHVPLYITMMKGKELSASGLRASFDRWAIDYRMADHLVKDREGNCKGPQNLHLHPFAAMMATAFCQRFQAKGTNERQHILNVLYKGGEETTLTDVLTAFDIHTLDDVREAAEETCRNFKVEIAALVPHLATPTIPIKSLL